MGYADEFNGGGISLFTPHAHVGHNHCDNSRRLGMKG